MDITVGRMDIENNKISDWKFYPKLILFGGSQKMFVNTLLFVD